MIDEAHKLKNAHRQSNRNGQAIRQAFSGSKKILLSATPLQNSLTKLYGLSTILDEHLFSDEKLFKETYLHGQNRAELKQRLKGFIQRTLRNEVQEYVRYTKRHAPTQGFEPSDQEQAFY